MPLWAVRLSVTVVGLLLWFWTQRLIARRGFPAGGIGDRVLEWTAPIHGYLCARPGVADRLLIATSALIDALGAFLLFSAIFGPSVRPLLGLLILFGLRQVCQGLCSLPCPGGMIWRDPGFPSLLVTYGTASDLFFSGHTALAVYGCLELARWGGLPFAIAGAAIALVEAATVLALRAHYTMDVFTGALAALWVWTLAGRLAPYADAALARLAG